MTSALPHEELTISSGQLDLHRLAIQTAAWRRRSARVRSLRIILPLLILLVLTSLIGWAVARTWINSLELLRRTASSEIRMTNPRFYGINGDGQRYVIGAKEAARSRAAGSDVRLVAPKVDLHGNGEKGNFIQAEKGVYNERSQKLYLTDKVVMSGGPSGMIFQTEQAEVDSRNNRIDGSKPIEGRGPFGEIKASSFTITDNGKRIIFRGNGENKVTAVINPTR
ncbi:MAG: LPS export ABC transporter periplasmic protein LptC [Asticcacaulis sp.]